MRSLPVQGTTTTPCVNKNRFGCFPVFSLINFLIMMADQRILKILVIWLNNNIQGWAAVGL